MRSVAAVTASGVVGFGAGQAIEAEPAVRFALADAALLSAYAYGQRGFACVARVGACDALAYSTLWIGVLGLFASHLLQVYDSAVVPRERHHACVRALGNADTLRR